MNALASTITDGKKCRVTGRYMDGTTLVAYHLVGEDGSQEKASKERVIYLIKMGSLENMRLQVVGNEITIRGKGQNLLSLPVWDESKRCFRDDAASKTVANSSVRTNSQYENQMGQFKITSRIMFKNACIGYRLTDNSGNETQLKRDQVLQLAIKRLISNATAQKIYGSKTDETTGQTVSDVKVILRGSGINLNELPVLIVDPTTGKIVDPSAMIEKTTCRTMYVKANGVIKDTKGNKVITFKAGDYIICYGRGEIAVKKPEEIKRGFVQVNNTAVAACDAYIDNRRYVIDIFNGKPSYLTDTIIKKWVIIKSKEN